MCCSCCKVVSSAIMSLTDTLDRSETGEELDDVPLVRMEDVQPESHKEIGNCTESEDEQVIETCVVENLEYESEYVLNDDYDSNIGSMVSVKSELELVDGSEDSNTTEMIFPELVKAAPFGVPIKIELETNTEALERWPTLEILPGGVIKRGDQDGDYKTLYGKAKEEKEPIDTNMMYACAKCSQKFQFLAHLVKHVKWHKDQEEKPKYSKLTQDKQLSLKKREKIKKNKLKVTYKKKKIKE